MRVVAGRRRRELDQHAARPLRMKEADHAGEPRPRRLVDQRQPGAPRALELRADVRGLEADVMEALAAALEELRHAARGVDRLEELDLAPPDREERRAHALVADGRLLRYPEPQRVLPEGEPVLEAANDEPDVVNARQHGGQAKP